MPRTSGTEKLKRAEIGKWVTGQSTSAATTSATTSAWDDALQRFAGSRAIAPETPIEDLGLSSLDRIQLMMEFETRTGIALNEDQFAAARTVGDLSRLKSAPPSPEADRFEFPEWNRSSIARGLRRLLLPTVILPLGRAFAWTRVCGLENLDAVQGPVIFASNHQSHFDLPSILWSLPFNRRYRLATAMSKEFFDAHFHPERYAAGERFRSGLMYFFSCLLLNTFRCRSGNPARGLPSGMQANWRGKAGPS